MPLLKRDVSLGDLYVAYRKAKVEAYYENTHVQALAFTEYEQNLAENLARLHRILLDKEETWSSDLEFIGTYAYLPKSIEATAWNDHSGGHFSAVDPIADWKRRFDESGKRAEAKLRLIIRPSVDFQVITALWIMKVDHLFDASLNPALSYANRLRRSRVVSSDESRREDINLSATGLFVPYFSAYRQWREKGLAAMEDALSRGKSILAITMDIEQFYHRVCPRFLLRRRFLSAIQLRLSRAERSLTDSLLQAIETWYRSTPDYADRPLGAIPVGLSASKIIANVLLVELDDAIATNIRPLYYGRYVDDIFLVFENTQQLDGGRAVAAWLTKTLAPLLKPKRDSSKSPSLRVDLAYARDSELIFAGPKQKIFALSSPHGLDLIEHIREQIRLQSSEHRLLPVVPESGAEMASRALLASHDATRHVDALRKADSVSVRRLGLSLLLGDIEIYASDLRPSSWSVVRREFYALITRHALTPFGFFEFATYLPRVFGIMLGCGDFDAASDFISVFAQVAELLQETSTVGKGKQQSRFMLCMKHCTEAFRQTALQAATRQTSKLDSRYLSVLRKLRLLDPDVSLPSSSERLGRLAHQLLLADWGSRPYKEFWYMSQSTDESGPPVPRETEVRRKLRLGAIRRFRKLAGRLKVPHWPALAFPTRPLRVDEIPLAAPDVLNDPNAYRKAIMALRGARVLESARIGIEPEPPSPKAFTTFVVPGAPRERITIGISSYKTTEDQWKAAALGRHDRSLLRYRGLNDLINRMLTEPVRPDYIVFPELSIPLRWALRFAKKLASNRVSFLSGVEYHRDTRPSVLRNDCLVSLVTNWPGYASHVVRLQSKFAAAHQEAVGLRRVDPTRNKSLYRPTGYLALPTLYVHRGYCFSVLICSDLTTIANRSVLCGELDTLFVLEWNSDVKTFSSLVEATAMDLHTFVVQVNNRLYGDSRIRVPAKEDYLRDVVQVKGGISDYYVLGQIDYQSLRQEQRRKSPRIFKPTPIGFTMSQRRRVK
ncbi:RNA-directed DNA polymerase [Acidicapsa dinghuensis]|uniref:RNA-directed DNA polymerase n=2 Tax=Acidicapsa dinghuensis TaxID=2218256 RepID=A0ABW1EF23_9BACT